MTFTPVRCAIKLCNCVCDREPSRTLFDQRLYSECVLAFGRGEEKYTQSCQINLESEPVLEKVLNCVAQMLWKLPIQACML